MKIPHTEPVEYEFRWGLRAEKEVSKLKILEFVGEVCSFLLMLHSPRDVQRVSHRQGINFKKGASIAII